MSPKQGRHRRGPGGPRRTTRTAPPSTHRPRPGPDLSGLVDPTLGQLVSTVVTTAGNAIDPDHPAPGVQLEQWALGVAATSFAAEAMPEQFYADLGRGLAEVADPLGPAVLAALAVVLDHTDAGPLRQARRDWLLGIIDADVRDADLGLGREVPVGAVTIGAPGEVATSLVIGFASPGGDHAIGLLVDPDEGGAARDLWIGSALAAVAADARSDPDLVVTDLTVAEARALAESGLAAADDTGGFVEDDELLLPLLHRRLALLPRT